MREILILTVITASVIEAQSTARPLQGSAVISAGPNVQVSKAFPQLAHYENLAAGDLDHAGRLLVCATVAHEDLAGQGDHCYVSFDSGKTWSTVLERDKGVRNTDPAVTYGRGDTVFFTNEYTPNPGFGGAPFPGTEQNRLEVFRSADGGKSWEQSALLPFIDRQAIVVDETNGRYAGRIYISGVSKGYYFAGGPASVHLYRSTDGGKTFVGPLERPTVEGEGLLGSSTSVVLSDGTLAFSTFMVKEGRSLNAFDEGAQHRSGNAQLQLLTSTDGGESLNPWVTISDVYFGSSGAQFANLAVDPGSRFFKDRLYAVWPDAASGKGDVRVAYSADKGKTWSAPIRVNDDRPPAERGRGPDHLLPTIGVNKDGVVLVAWYDRRDSEDNLGWKVRAAASLDGGVTFTPSVVISEAANVFTDRTLWIQGAPGLSGGGIPGRGGRPGSPLSVRMAINSFFTSGGDTNGMAVGADGVFHPMWVDNRTGVSQLWTAAVTVRGNVERHGARELADLDDITDRVSLEARSTSYDRSTGLVTLTARLKNVSKETLRAPVKVRVVSLSSQLGVPAVVGATNGVTTVGAIWDVSSAIPAAGLLPDSTSAPAALRFRLSDVRPLRARRDGGFASGLVSFDARVFARRASGPAAAP